MKKLFCFILLLVIPNVLPAQTGFDGTYILTTQEEQQKYIDEYVFTNDSIFKFTHLEYLGNECGTGTYSVKDTVLTLTFSEIPAVFRDSLRSYYEINENKIAKGDTCEYSIDVFDHKGFPVPGTSIQIVDSNEFNIVDKIKKYWETDSSGNAIIRFPKDIDLFGLKIAIRGFQTVVIPVKKDKNKTVTVKLLESEKCVHIVGGGTIKKFYLKNVRFSGFYLRGEDSQVYKYFKKKD